MDTLCLDQNSKGGYIRKAVYRHNLWTGIHTLEPNERWALNFLFAILAGTFCRYTLVFWLEESFRAMASFYRRQWSPLERFRQR
eukprot:scaffold13_cov311-Chaetoceros_neogracile.AAC.3